MNESWKIILQNIITLIQEYQDESILNNHFKIEQIENLIKTNYQILCEHEEIDQFYKFLYSEFGDENELYPLLLSILYSITLDEKCLQAVLKFLAEGKIDLFYSIFLRRQVESNIFTNYGMGKNYELSRKVHKIQLSQLEQILNVSYQYIPWEERNNDKIIIVTNQFLSKFHAPTRNVVELCSALADMGKEVIIIVALEKQDNTYESWRNPYTSNHIEEFNGNYVINYYGHSLSGYQFFLSGDNLSEIRSIISNIYNMKPQFIWYMGGTSLFADLFRNWTTVISMPFTDGYSISEAPIMIEYMKSKSKDTDSMEFYLAKENQKAVHFTFEQVIRPSLIPHNRLEFNLPEDAFLITIVGSRLEYELNEDFLEIINKILLISPIINIVVIGVIDSIQKINNDRVYFLGIQMDLIGVLRLMDLFLNPPRKGGGTGAYWSLFNSVPVVTLDNCDVANCVTKEFICNNADEMVEMVERHLTDQHYHQQMKRKAKDIINENERKNDLKANIEILINNINK